MTKAEYKHCARNYRLHDRMRVLTEREGMPGRAHAHAYFQDKYSRLLPTGTRRLTLDSDGVLMQCRVDSSEAVEAALVKTYNLQ